MQLIAQMKDQNGIKGPDVAKTSVALGENKEESVNNVGWGGGVGGLGVGGGAACSECEKAADRPA